MTESPSTARGTTRRRVVLGVVAALAVAIAVVVGIVVWGGSSGHEVSSDEAGRRIGTATSIAPVQGVLRPEQGVYRYRGSGTDALSTPPKEQIEEAEARLFSLAETGKYGQGFLSFQTALTLQRTDNVGDKFRKLNIGMQAALTGCVSAQRNEEEYRQHGQHRSDDEAWRVFAHHGLERAAARRAQSRGDRHAATRGAAS